MSAIQPTVQFQAEHHDLVATTGFRTVEEYCLYLIHLKAYQEAASLADGKVVLDLGCNNGYGTDLLRARSRQVIGVDVSRRALQEAQLRYGTEALPFVLVDGTHLPLAEARFDLVVSFQVIEHINDYDAYLSEIKRVLAPGGVALFATPNARLRLDPDMVPWNPFHVHEFSADELRDLLAGYFPKVRVRGLFGGEALYAIEYRRVTRARDAARVAAALRATRRFALRTKIKNFVPAVVLKQLRRARSALRGRAEAPTLTTDFAQTYSTADLFYRDSSLETALDLLAVCHVDR